ncbi:hypothetical protein QBC40DRAFT_212780 [Triangularia verruculosa]|uniref:Uncharacterized protein n=1 Tax=Triangularia verruculosa TaxID=2587418 RepID=A0AAN6X6D6_9PEZI|nr:hypothetical protein QBC40DRAFT_212780 [Triangularia verruculosa]
MDALYEDTFGADSDNEEWSDAEWNKRVPRGSWKWCLECRDRPNVCKECKFWMENYGCPRPENCTEEPTSPRVTESRITGSLSTSATSLRPYRLSQHEDQPGTQIRTNNVSPSRGFESWSTDSVGDLTSSWTSIPDSSHSITYETLDEHRVHPISQQGLQREYNLGESYVSLDQLPVYGVPDLAYDPISNYQAPTWYSPTQHVVAQQTVRHQGHTSSTAIYQEETRTWHNTSRHISMTASRETYSTTTRTFPRTHRRTQTPKAKPPSPFDSSYIHVLFPHSHAFSTCHTRGLWAPRPFHSANLDSSWRWKYYKRSVLRLYGLPGLAEVQMRGWTGSVDGNLVWLRIVLLEWPKILWGWVTGWTRNEIGGLIGLAEIDDGAEEVL